MEIGARKNFFVMTKLAKDTPLTDEGWVYGIVDSDTRKVIASGKVASCIYCHKDANNDRMFGPTNPIELEYKESPKRLNYEPLTGKSKEQAAVGDLPIPNPAPNDDYVEDEDGWREPIKTKPEK